MSRDLRQHLGIYLLALSKQGTRLLNLCLSLLETSLAATWLSRSTAAQRLSATHFRCGVNRSCLFFENVFTSNVSFDLRMILSIHLAFYVVNLLIIIIFRRYHTPSPTPLFADQQGRQCSRHPERFLVLNWRLFILSLILVQDTLPMPM